MKQLYCLSTILFCTNPQCNMPLQYLLSDAILCLGGSTELVKLLNRIGAVASLDTHDRVVTCAVKDRIAKGIGFELQPQTFTVTSIDNIDIMQRHAMVSSTESKRSWHGTSIQAVQPMPLGIVLSQDELCYSLAVPQTHTQVCIDESTCNSGNPGKRYSSSPTMSPIPKQVEKRQRTLREHCSTHTRTQVAGDNEISPDMFTNMYECTAYQRPTISQFTIRSFKIFPEEKRSLDQLQEAIFQYLFIKEGKSVELDLPGLTSYLSAALYTNNKNEQSKVVYIYYVNVSLL